MSRPVAAAHGLRRGLAAVVLCAAAALPVHAQQFETSPQPGFLDRQPVNRTPNVAPSGVGAPREPAPQQVPLTPLAPQTAPQAATPPAALAAPAPRLAPVSMAPAAPAQPAPTPSTSQPAPAQPAPVQPVAQPGAAAPDAPAGPQYPDVWQPRPLADLVALDKVTAHVTPLAGRLDQPMTFGSLTVVVRACVVRPPDQPADAAAFLEITDSNAGAVPFRGWMSLANPSMNNYEHPIYDIRLAGCRAR